ncbi:MAG: Hpt domain-containing protein [Saprospiraceae bacterium]
MKKLNKNTNTEVLPLVAQSIATQVADLPVSFDLGYLEKISRNNLKFIKEIITIFLNEIPAAMEKISIELKDENWIQVANLAHRVKTNYMMLGMTPQEKNALSIERMIKENRFTPTIIITNVNQLIKDSSQLYPILEKELERRNQLS